MKVFVFTYDRWGSATTPNLLTAAGIDHLVLVHDQPAAELYMQHGTADHHSLVVTGVPKGLANNRNAALALMRDDEWALFLVDDITRVTALGNRRTASSPLPVRRENQHVYRERFKHEVGMKGLYVEAGHLARNCERVGARLGGWAGNDNAMFRRDHYKANVLADGRAWVVRKDATLRFDPNVQMIDDVAWCAANLERWGRVLVDQWVLPSARRYTAGGFGSIDQRMDQKLAEAAYLVHRYPRFVRYQDKPGWPPGAHVVLKRSTPTVPKAQLAVLR